jgi:Ca2+:H+ antiporter
MPSPYLSSGDIGREENGEPRESDSLVGNGNGTTYGTADHYRQQISNKVNNVVRYSFGQLKIILFSNYVNAFLVFVPIGIAGGIFGWNPTAVFVLNFLAIIPLAALLSFATEELALEVGETLGGLMNVST